MNRGNGRGGRADLKLNISPPRPPPPRPRVESPNQSASPSPPTSCISSDECSTSPEATSMMLVGCPRCLMYVMLSVEDPKCPKCKSTVLLDVIHDDNANNRRRNKKN